MRVFISSTFRDLQEYREAASRAIHSLEAYSDDMIYWSADPRDGAQHSVDRVKECDLVILILAHRYGYVPEGEQYSVTEMEYRTAVEEKIPVLAFFVDETIPWPPAFIESEKTVELRQFKQLVETQVTRKLFKSPEQLEALISQAMYSYLDRHKRQHTNADALQQRAVSIASAAELKSKSDLLLHIGESVDGLPMVLNIERSEPLESRFATIEQILSEYSSDSLRGIFETLKQEITFFAQKTWSTKHLSDVRMQDGSVQEMYITPSTLTQLFQSTLSLILSPSSQTSEDRDNTSVDPTVLPSFHDQNDDLGTQVAVHSDEASGELESQGGSNRFLGISIATGGVYSVGKRQSGWVEWRSFHSEVISPTFENARVNVNGLPVALHDYENYLLNYLLQEGGTTSPSTALVISRQSVIQAISRIALQVEHMHVQNQVHGDLKPKNVLLTEDGPLLIDNFRLEVGDVAPGWTINWSAPEQALGEPVSKATDIYPLGRMLSALLRSKLVGELKVFSVPGDLEPQYIYVNPSPYLEGYDDLLDGKNAYEAWRSFISKCLRFSPNERPKDVGEFLDELSSLEEKYPLKGDIVIDLTGEIMTGKMPDGSVKICRTINPTRVAETRLPYGYPPPPTTFGFFDNTGSTNLR